MNNITFCSQKPPSDKKIGVTGEAGKVGKKYSTTSSGNQLQEKASYPKKHNTPSIGNILVVDDTHAQLHLLIGILSEQGYKVRPVPSGQLALKAIESTLPDLILLDILMPQMDGYEVCSKLKASSRTKDVPVIFISALDEVFDKVKAFEVGGVDYITKPFHTQEVVARIENQLTISRLSKQLTEQNIRLSEEIEERKLAEAALAESERKYRHLVETSQDVIWSIDTQGCITFINQAVKQVFGYEPEEMLGRPFTDFMPPKQRAKELEVFQRLKRKALRQYETIGLAKDNRPIHLLLNAIALLDEQGQVVGATGTASDISDRKLAEAEILRTKDLFESIFHESTDAIFLVNPETGLTLDCNQRAVELCEAISKDELLNNQSHTLQTESFTPKQLCSLLDEIALNGFWSREVEYVTKKGKPFWGDIAAKPIHVAGQTMNLVRLTDITDRKISEEALRQSEARFREQAQELELALNQLKCTQSQLIQAEKMLSLGQMVAGVAHEINNPVTFIYGNLTPAREYFQDLSRLIEIYQKSYPNPTPEIRQMVEEIELDFLREDWQQLMDSMQVGAERIRQIVRSLVLFSRNNTLDKKAVDIHNSIDNTLLLLQHRLGAEGSRAAGRDRPLFPEIQVIKEYGQLPKVTCYEEQLNQVFMNLLSNAIDALETQPSPRMITIRTEVSSESSVLNCELEEPHKTQNGLRPATLTKRTRLRPASLRDASRTLTSRYGAIAPSYANANKTQNVKSVVIRIADNGPGMSEVVRQKMFDPFFTTKPVGSGMGLGLSVSYQIVVEKHNGQISCISAPGQGTELVVEIPVTYKAQ